MPKGPKGQKRPADVIGNAVKIAKTATHEIEDEIDENGKNKAAQALGRKGGAARAKTLTKEQREEIARKAAQTRWKKTSE
ncbi:MAG: RNA-binding protein [Gammaproteobacteria bacterium]